ncbi:MAG: ADP-ribosylglycohydrolase family protein [Bacteroidales bacterium]|nr:ADP-ribosylglycohydrolase family protein [Bacteroidales bacterium]
MKSFVRTIFALSISVILLSCNSGVTISKETLLDKIKGAWAGQAIGCTYGGPTEFRYCERVIDDSITIQWPDGYLKYYFDNSPGLYDDVYMDLTFVNVFEKLGLDAPTEAFAQAFAHAPYPLWHANQQARYNILHGIMPPQSGSWEANPHADDIDFQIEADYAGIMSPGMVNTAAYYCDSIGHIMNYGDGWYGGVYVAAMYALAFVSDDIQYVVEEALKVIPEQSKYHQCMSDIISWHKQHPADWKATWQLCQDKWGTDIGCPDGVFSPFDIDATINSAYILIGLLYGEKDFEKTIDISTRCGQDSDCNPASAGGILATMLGYSNIPEKFMANLREVEDRAFAYTDISLNKVYRMSMNQALQVISRNGGKISEGEVVIRPQKPQAVRLEQGFTDLRPKERMRCGTPIATPQTFIGKGVVAGYSFDRWGTDYVAKVAVKLDNEVVETVELPNNQHDRRLQLFHKYGLSPSTHTISFEWLNPTDDVRLTITDLLIYE